MKLFLTIFLALALLAGTGCNRQEPATPAEAQAQLREERSEAVERLREAGEVLNSLMKVPEDQIPEWVLARAHCVAIVPTMVKGGFVFGAKHGRGVATCREGGNWSAPAFFTLTGGSWGAQIGLEAVDLVMVIMNEEGMRNLLSANWKIGAAGSVAAGPVGREAAASMSGIGDAQILIYSRAKGLYAGLTLEGASVSVDEQAVRAMYGELVPFQRILSENVQAPAGTEPFLSAVRQHFRQAKAQQQEKSGQ